MKYTKEDWKKRLSERSDLSISLVHLTKPNDGKNVIEVMYKILNERKLKGSTNTGFINGTKQAVCFQDAPIHSVCQNVWFEKKLTELHEREKIRYYPCGLLFHKQFIYKSGGRPVIYDQTDEAKKYLSEDQFWRIVSFDLSDNDKFIDWTHEREWRVPGDLEFSLDQVTLLFPQSSHYKDFIKLCDKENKPVYKDVSGVIVTDKVFF